MILQITTSTQGTFTVKLEMILAFEDNGGFEFNIYFKGVNGLKIKVPQSEFDRIKKLWLDAVERHDIL